MLPHATTGIASDLLIGGRTMHSGFKIPLMLNSQTKLNVSSSSKLGKNLLEADLIIIDEASSMRKDALRCINELLKELTQSFEHFGGKVILLGGDFRQTLPIVEMGTAASIIGNSLPSYNLYKENF